MSINESYLKAKLDGLETYLGKAENCLWDIKQQLTEDQKKQIEQLYSLTNEIAVKAYKIANINYEG